MRYEYEDEKMIYNSNMSPIESISPSEHVVDDEESPAEGTSWQNPGEFPQFDSEKAVYEINREKNRAEAEKQYQEELSFLLTLTLLNIFDKRPKDSH